MLIPMAREWEASDGPPAPPPCMLPSPWPMASTALTRNDRVIAWVIGELIGWVI